MHVRRLCVQCQIAPLHVFGHALTKRCHGRLLEMEFAASSSSMLSHRSLLYAARTRRPSTAAGETLKWSCYGIPPSGLVQLRKCRMRHLRRTCAKLCRKAGEELEQIQFLLGHASIQTTERYFGSQQDLVQAVNDRVKIRVIIRTDIMSLRLMVPISV